MKYQLEQGGVITLTDEGIKQVQDSPLWNEDLRPTTQAEHHWRGVNYATLWISMCLCIPAYQMSAGMIALGMNWWQAVFTVFLGNAIIMIAILLNSHAGTRFGIPYPVFARLWFGSKGAHIPSLARAIVGAGWFGINSWIGGTAIDTLISAFFAGWNNIPGHTAITFIAFWLLNIYIAYKGPEAIRRLTFYAAPILGVLSVILLIWALTAAGGWGPMLSAPSKFATIGEFMKVFWPSLTGVIAFWATLALNIPDFTRYATSQRAQAVAQAVTMPLTMAAFSFISIAVTSATVVIFGQALWDPVALIAHFHPIVIIIGTIAIVLSSVALNISANLVAPARAIENLWPKKITFGMGAIITGILALALQPWYIMENFGNYIFGWLGTYAALLGPIDGIAIADYWLVRKRRIHLVELYKLDGRYSYAGGFNKNAIYALALGLAVAILGLLVPGLSIVWDNIWFVGLFVSGIAYWLLMKNDSSLVNEDEFRHVTMVSKEVSA